MHVCVRAHSCMCVGVVSYFSAPSSILRQSPSKFIRLFYDFHVSRTGDAAGKAYYGGLVDHALVMRTIIVEFNYDYIFDFVFHASGALETRTYATGYIMSEWFHYGEDPFGFRVHDDIVGLLHHHLFHIKLDIDVGGASNRYETLDLTVDERQWPWLTGLLPTSNSSSSSAASLQQISFRHNIRRTEREAVKHRDVDKPMYHIFYNDQNKNKFGNPRAYRLDVRGYSGQILPDDHLALRSRKWANYPMGVTKRKEEEDRSSSIYSMFDANDPVRDFESYILDNDDIVDQVKFGERYRQTTTIYRIVGQKNRQMSERERDNVA